MRKERALRALGASAAAGAAMSAIDRIVPTAGIATVTAARMSPRIMRSLRAAPRAAPGSTGSKQWARSWRCPTAMRTEARSRTAPAHQTSAGETVMTDPVRKELTARGRGLNQVARKYPAANPAVRTMPAAPWLEIPGIDAR